MSKNGPLLSAPVLTYIAGEEMTRYAGQLYLDKWIKPWIDTSNWQFFDLSCVARDKSNDQVLRDAIVHGKKSGAIYKEPTITPTDDQVKQFGLKKQLKSPNGIMRAGWNGITISRDTIHIPGMELGYKNPVLFDRHAVGGEYGAGYHMVGAGHLQTRFINKPDGKIIVVDDRDLTDKINAVVVYHNPYDNVGPMAHHFFSRCLEAHVTPYVVTKKTVFKWQEQFWTKMKHVFDGHYKDKFSAAGLLKKTGGELQHFLSDVATMQLVRWSDGGFGMCSHNYDGDVLTDEIAQIHRSPGFLTSVLNGVNDDGSIIKEYEASHGTVTDMEVARLAGKETSLNPLSMMEALIGAIQHSIVLSHRRNKNEEYKSTFAFTVKLRSAIHAQMVAPGKATRDLSGPQGLTTEQFVDAVAARVRQTEAEHKPAAAAAPVVVADAYEIDVDKIKEMFNILDENGDGHIVFEEFIKGTKKLGIAPKKLTQKKQ